MDRRVQRYRRRDAKERVTRAASPQGDGREDQGEDMAKNERVARDPIPALYTQCLEVYEAMADQAEMTQAYPDDPQELLVYEGFLTRLITQDLHYSNPYYTKVTKRLKGMDSIRQIKRGGSTSPSRWALIQTPTLELFNSVPEMTSNKRASMRENLEQQIRDLNKRLTDAGL